MTTQSGEPALFDDTPEPPESKPPSDDGWTWDDTLRAMADCVEADGAKRGQRC